MKWCSMLVVWSVWPAVASAVTIDSFSAGGISRGPEQTELVDTQAGLPAASVIGGARDWVAFYGGTLAVDAAGDQSLTLDHDRGPFEIASIRYGALLSSSTMPQLNSDFSAAGGEQVTLRIRRMQIVADEGAPIPLAIGINLRSHVGEPNTAGAVAYAKAHNSAEPYVLQIPFENFQAAQGAIDFSDIDGIGVTFFFQGRGLIEVDDISTTAGLPGDYNLSGTVDAADFTVWRDRKGEAVTLPNENPAAQTPGIVDDEDFVFWKSRFGNAFPATPASGLGTAVPEPSIWQLVLVAAIAFAAIIRVH